MTMPSLPLVQGANYLPTYGASKTCQASEVADHSFKPCKSRAWYEAYFSDPADTAPGIKLPLCGRHYKAAQPDVLQLSAKDFGFPDYYPLSAVGIFADATPEQEQQVAETLKLMFAVRAGTFRDVCEAPSGPGIVPFGAPTPLTSLSPMNNAFGEMLPISTSSGYVRVPYRCGGCGATIPDNPSRTGIIGFGGPRQPAHTEHSYFGIFHEECRLKMIPHLSGIGYQYFEECEHVECTSEQNASSTTATFECIDCLGSFEVTSNDEANSVCERCRASGSRGEMYRSLFQGSKRARCAGCATYHAFARHSYTSIWEMVAPYGLNAPRNIVTALADTYTLMELSFYSQKAAQVLEDHALTLANEFAAYSLVACGGELRYTFNYIGGPRRMYLVARPQDRGRVKDGELFVCTLCMRANTCVADASAHTTFHFPVIGIEGTINAPPHLAYGKGMVRLPITTPIEFNGIRYEPYAPPSDIWAKIRTTGLRNGRRRERFQAWKEWHKLTQDDPVPYMEICAAIFNTGSWTGGVGGPLWGTGAALVAQYLKKELTPLHYVDLVFGLQHNGGPFLNKAYCLPEIYNTPLKTLLDIRRDADSSEELLPFASPYVLSLWTEVYEETQEPALYPGYMSIKEAGAVGALSRVTRFTTARKKAKAERRDTDGNSSSAGLLPSLQRAA